MKISIQIVIQVFFFILSHTTYGQNNYEEVVYLKNGSIIRGIIIEQIPNQNIKIQTKDRNVFVFKYEEIEKMTKEELPIYNKINKNDITNYKKKGFINITEINYCPGIGNLKAGSNLIKNVDYSLGLRTINGYQINENISLTVIKHLMR